MHITPSVVEESYGVIEDSDSVSVCLRIEAEAAESFYITADSHPVQAEGTFSKLGVTINQLKHH